MTDIHIVKRKGHKELFDERKVYATCYAACLNAHLTHKGAEQVCEKVARHIRLLLKGKKEVSSHFIFQQVIRLLKKEHKDAAFMYETHRDIS